MNISYIYPRFSWIFTSFVFKVGLMMICESQTKIQLVISMCTNNTKAIVEVYVE